jgi:TPR repeat protein
MSGSGVAQDRDAAAHWYRQAARQNHEGAARRLAAIGVTLVDD